MKFFRNMSIGMQLLTLAISTGLIVVTLILIIYFEVTDVIKKDNNEYTTEMSYRIKQNISNNCSMLNSIITSVAYNSVVQDYLMGADGYERVELFYKINNFLSNMQEMNEGIIDIALLSDYGNSYYLKGLNASVKKILEGIPDKTINFYTGTQVLKYNDREFNCFMVITTVYSINQDKHLGEKIGTAALILNTDILGIEPDSEFKRSSTDFYLMDRNKQIYSGNDYSNPESYAKIAGFISRLKPGRNVINQDNDKLIVREDKIPEIGGNIISVTSEKRLLTDLSWIRKLVFFILLLSGLILSGLFIAIIYNIEQPLKRFMGFIKTLKSGNIKDFKQRITLVGNTEVGVMAEEFNSLLDEINNLTYSLVSANTRLYETELEKKKSELSYLRSQINPHFLYNTLETLKGMAVDEGAYKTMDMAKALGQIFRYSIKGTDIVLLREELEMVQSYVQIQKIRFNKRFEVVYEFNENVLDCMLPKMILQPVVENAVIHGIEGKIDNGSLWVGGELDGQDELRIWVKDNGTGMKDDRLDKIKASLFNIDGTSSAENENASIGLMNVQNRIRLIYGHEYGINIDSKPGEGTMVIFKIPARRYTNV
jgi:Putative regulator of cell autolysis